MNLYHKKCEMNFEYIQNEIRIENFQQTIKILDRILNFFQLARSAVEFSEENKVLVLKNTIKIIYSNKNCCWQDLH